MNNRFDVIIVGAGPCGIAAAVEAKLSGIDKILVIEKAKEHSQTFRNFYKDGKRVDKEYKGCVSDLIGNVGFEAGTKESTLEHFDSLINTHEIECLYGCEVEKILKNDDEFEVFTANGNFISKNIIIAVGKMGKPNKPDYKIPLTLTKVVNYDLNQAKGDEKIIVVGGGNSAAEYALELSQKNKTTLCYRRDKFTRLNDINLENIENANKNGEIELKMGVDIISVEDENGKVKLNFNNETSDVYDRVIYAIGGSTPVEFLRKCGVNLDENNMPILDENNQTPIKGLYVGGDIATKNGGSIVVALNHAHLIIKDILKK